MSAKNTVKFFAVLGGITALSAEIFYDFSINTKSPIHMSKLNNLRFACTERNLKTTAQNM